MCIYLLLICFKNFYYFSWDQQYLLEQKNFEEIGDRGEVWFGEGAMNRMIRWLEKNVSTSSNIIDVGCGNGVMSIELYEVGFKNILGVDYSSHAIELAQKIANENENEELKFKVSNVVLEALLMGSVTFNQKIKNL